MNRSFREAVKNDPQLEKSCGDAWNTVAETLKVYETIYKENDLLEKGSAFDCRLFKIARTLVRLAEETAKPNADRLREYRESNLESLKLELFADTPHLQGSGDSHPCRFAELFHRNGWLRQQIGRRGVRRQIAGRTRRRNWSKARNCKTWRFAKNWPRAGKRPSKHRPIP